MPTRVRRATVLAMSVVILAGCDGDAVGGDLVEGVPGSSAATPAITGAPRLDVPTSVVRTIATGLRVPWGLAFLPDGTALVTERGNPVPYFDSEIAQDRGSLGGKILRMTADGKPAPGNPFANSLVWSYGHRNVQGLAWDLQGRMYASEFGSKTYDELNRIEPGHNYGWPRVEGFGTDPEHTNPIATWTPTNIASPSGIAVLGDHIYVACLRGQALYRLDLDGRNPRRLLHTYGRLRTVTVAPDGSLWVTTSNRDQVGREDRLPQTPEGDRILRFTPP